MKAKLILGALLLFTLANALVILPSRPVNADQPNNEPKVTICHRSDAVNNPYQQISVATSSVDGGNDNGDHYSEHQGPLADSEAYAQTLKDAQQKWGDIIPPVPGFHTGLNWTAPGIAMYNNGCNYVTQVEPAEPTFVDPTCETSGQYTIPTKTGVIYKVNGNIVAANLYYVANGSSVTIEAFAASTAYTLTGTTSWSHDFYPTEECDNEETVANIHYGVTCTDQGAEVTLTNDGSATGDVTVNGEVITVGINATVTRTFDTTDKGLKITVIIDDQTVYDQVMTCTTGTVLGTSTDQPITKLPRTSGDMTLPILAIVGAATAAIGLASMAARTILSRR